MLGAVQTGASWSQSQLACSSDDTRQQLGSGDAGCASDMAPLNHSLRCPALSDLPAWQPDWHVAHLIYQPWHSLYARSAKHTAALYRLTWGWWGTCDARPVRPSAASCFCPARSNNGTSATKPAGAAVLNHSANGAQGQHACHAAGLSAVHQQNLADVTQHKTASAVLACYSLQVKWGCISSS